MSRFIASESKIMAEDCVTVGEIEDWKKKEMREFHTERVHMRIDSIVAYFKCTPS